MGDLSATAFARTPIRDCCMFYRSYDIAPKIKPNPRFPRCYEQMEKFVCKWFVSGRDINGNFTEVGPLSYDEALAIRRASRPQEADRGS